MSWFTGAIKKYAVFKGRARRKEFWYFSLFFIIFLFVLGLIDLLLGTYPLYISLDFGEIGRMRFEFGVFTGLYGLALLLPSLAIWVRRLHDCGRSAWWLFIALVPIIGIIVLLIFAVSNSEAGENRYGRNPKAWAEA